MMNYKHIFILSLLFLFSACGDLFTKDIPEDDITLTQGANCQLDIGAFSYIFEQDIGSEIDCLKGKIDLFIKNVETDRPGYVSKKVLKEFLRKGPIDVEPDVIDMVDSIFDISHIMIGTNKNYIKNTDVDILLDFLKYFNVHIRETFRFFKDDRDVNYARHQRERRVVFEEISLITNRLKSIFKYKRSTLDRIDTKEFVYNFFKTEPTTLEKVRSVMFAKRVFLGGDKWDLTHLEFSDALDIIPELTQVAFDVAKMDHYTFENKQETLINLFLTDVSSLKNLLYFTEDSQEAIFTVQEAIDAVTNLAGDLLPFDLADYPKEVMKLKEVFLGDGTNIVFARELFVFLQHLENVFSNSSFAYRVYNSPLYNDELNSEAPITHDFGDFPVTTSLEKKYLENFARIANNYKFMKGKNSVPYFIEGYNRNDNAFFEIISMEYLIEQIMAHYGQQNPNARGGYDMTLDQSYVMIKDFKWFLKDQGLVTIGKKGGGELAGVNDNFVLLSTLFQYQSDGCDPELVCLEIPEATEFVITLLTALDVKDFFTRTMLDLCATELDQYDRIYPDCFRRNFLNVLNEPITNEDGDYVDDGRSISDFMPGLKKYIDGLIDNVEPGRDITDSPNYMHFITETEAFTRTCMYYNDETKEEEVPLKADDAFAVFAGLLNVESTVNRYDLDGNGKMDYRNANKENEVMKAYYSTYEGAIKALVAPDGGFMEILAKPIFKYLIKYGSVPDTKKFSSIWKFVKFLIKKNKNADAHRVTISTVLKVIGEQNNADDPKPFKCEECLRDPTTECDPEGDEWD